MSIFSAITPFIAPVAGMIGDFMQYEGQKDTNAANAQQAARQMEFQERMANTAHEREMNDLRRSGLNPILTATGGSGAATPAGAAARMENPAANLGDKVRASALTAAQTNNLKEDTVLKTQLQWQSSAQTEQLKRLGDLTEQQLKTEEQRTRTERTTADILGHDEKGRKLEGAIDDTRYGEIMRYIDRSIRAITGAGSAARSVK